MTDPYQVLGVPRSASDEDIKKAYRNLSRKYHPDANVNNPNKAQAEEKFKEVQQAYDLIMKEKQQGSSYGNYGGAYGRSSDPGFGGDFGGFSGRYSYQGSSSGDSVKMQAASNYIRNRAFAEALHVLNDIPFSERTGKWYYYSAVANAGTGNNATAIQHIDQAVTLEPSNMEYRQFEQYLKGGGTWYTHMGSSYDKPYSNYGSFCASLIFMNLLCTCCCRI